MWAFFARTPSPSSPHVHTMHRFIFVGSGFLAHPLHEFSCPFPPVLHNWSLSLFPFHLLRLVSLSLFIFPQSSLCVSLYILPFTKSTLSLWWPQGLCTFSVLSEECHSSGSTQGQLLSPFKPTTQGASLTPLTTPSTAAPYWLFSIPLYLYSIHKSLKLS